jgi:hypothetical protein
MIPAKAVSFMVNRAWLTCLCVVPMVLFFVAAAQTQAQPSGAPLGDEFSHTTAETYSDQFSQSCRNNSPYAGMDPLTCKGVAQPVDSYGSCSLRGMQLLQRTGSMCYYCQPINPPIDGIIIPLDQVQQAGQQGFRCTVDQADQNCMAVCTGGGTYIPPNQQPRRPSPPQAGGCTAPDYLSPAERARWYQTNVLSGRIRCGGGYNPCDNPDAPSWCTAQGQTGRTIMPDEPISPLHAPSQARRPCTRAGTLLNRGRTFMVTPGTYDTYSRGYNGARLWPLGDLQQLKFFNPGTHLLAAYSANNNYRRFLFYPCNCPDSTRITEGPGGDFLVTSEVLQNGIWQQQLNQPIAMRVIQRTDPNKPGYVEYDIYWDKTGTGNFTTSETFDPVIPTE